MKTSKSKYFQVILSEENTASFNALIGFEEQIKKLSNLVNYIKLSDKRYYDTDLKPSTNLTISGPVGCGKKSLIISLAKEIDLPFVNIFIPCLVDNKSIDDIFKKIGKLSKKYGKLIIYFDSIEFLSTLDENVYMYFYTELMEYINLNKDTICFLSLNSSAVIPEFVIEEGGFEKNISILEPELKIREQLFENFCSKFNVSDIDYNHIAKQTSGLTGGTIKLIVKKAMLQVLQNNQDSLNQDTLEDTIAEYLYGEKRKKTTDEERRLTAYHEAGHAVVGYYAGVKNISKIDIIHRDESLGLTISSTDEDKYTWTAANYVNQILLSFGGLCAERFVLGCNTSGVNQDLALATAICSNMVCMYGMDDELGPISLSSKIKNSSYTYEYPKLSDKADVIIQKRLKEYYEIANEILLSHTAQLEALTNALLEKEIITSNEMIEIFKKC